MTKNKYDLLKDEYSRYSKTDEAAAVFFVKKLVFTIDTKGKWIDVISSERYDCYDNKPAFKNVKIELFERKIKPKYPRDADEMLIRAITWKAAHEDIGKQRSCGIRGPLFEITGCSYNKNKGKFENKSFDNWNEEYGGFDHTGKVPTTSITLRVRMEPEWIYRITGVRRIAD